MRASPLSLPAALVVGLLGAAAVQAEEAPAAEPAQSAPAAEPAEPAQRAPAKEQTAPPPPPQTRPEPLDDRLDPSKDPLPDSGVGEALGTFFRTLLMLALVLGLAYLTLHKGVGKLMAKAQQGKSIQVVERITLEQRRSLVLVEVEGKRLLVGSSEGGMSVLADLSGEPGKPPASFAAALGAGAEPGAAGPPKSTAPPISEAFPARGGPSEPA